METQKNDQRSLKEIFENMERLRNKNSHETHEDVQHSSSEKNICHCDGETFVFIKQSPTGRVLAVCEACNPRVHCEKCLGTGHKRHFNLETLMDDLVPNGCECLQLEKRVEMFNRAHIPERYFFADLGKFDLAQLNEKHVEKFLRNQEIVYNFCEHADRFIRDSAEAHEKHFLVLMGPVGTGKTYLAVAALRRLIMQYGISGKFVDFQFLLGQLRDAYSKRGSEEDILRPLRQADILVIDEFGKGRTENEWQLEKLDDIVNSRYNAGKVTIITTNYLTPEALKDWHKQMSEEDRKLYMPGVNPALLQNSNLMSNDVKQTPSNESFWTQTLPERIGGRMYDRIVENSIFVDFLGLPSLRKLAAQDFYRRVAEKAKR